MIVLQLNEVELDHFMKTTVQLFSQSDRIEPRYIPNKALLTQPVGEVVRDTVKRARKGGPVTIRIWPVDVGRPRGNGSGQAARDWRVGHRV